MNSKNQRDARYHDCIGPDGVLTAKRLSDFPEFFHDRLQAYFSSVDCLNLSQTNQLLRNIYHERAYERCIASSKPKVENVWNPFFMTIPDRIIFNHMRYSWFPCYRLRILVLSTGTISKLLKLSLLELYLPISFPNLIQVVLQGAWDLELPVHKLKMLGSIPSIQMYFRVSRLYMSTFAQSLHWLNLSLEDHQVYPSFNQFPALKVLKLITSEYKLTSDKLMLIASAAHLRNLQHFSLVAELGPTLQEMVKSCPHNVKDFCLTVVVNKWSVDPTWKGIEGIIKSPVHLQHVSQFKLTSSQPAMKLCSEFLTHCVFSDTKLEYFGTRSFFDPQLFIQSSKNGFANISRLSITTGMDQRTQGFETLSKLVNLKYLTIAFGSEEFTSNEIKYSQGFWAVNAFFSQIIDKSWEDKTHSLALYGTNISEVLSNPMFGNHSDLLWGCLIKPISWIMESGFSSNPYLFNPQAQRLILRMIQLRDLLRLVPEFYKLERLELLETLFIFSNIALLPCIYKSPKLKSIMFTDYNHYRASNKFPARIGLDKKHLWLQPFRSNSRSLGIIDVEGIRNHYETKTLDISMDKDYFMVSEKNWFVFDTPVSAQSGAFGFSPFEKASGAVNYKNYILNKYK